MDHIIPLILPSIKPVTIKKQKGVKMKIFKKILIILVSIAAILLIGSAGELDHHEYIEANYYYSN